MDIHGAFSSNHLRAADLKGREVTVTMNRVVIEEVGQEKEKKPVLYFAGKEKGVVLNKTNSRVIAGMYGPETNNWAGQQIVLMESQTEFGGNTVPCIRVKLNSGVPAPAPAMTQPQSPDAPDNAEPGDDIPF